MSTPPNPLSQYHSYSYHHILLACDTTAVAEALQESNEFVTFMREKSVKNTGSDPFERYKTHDFKNKGKYIIVINGMTDAEFVIKGAQWLSIASAYAGSTGVDRFATLTVEGSMDIDEPRGVRFMNVMSTVADNLETDPSGIVFLLKTIFVGHTHDSIAYKQDSIASDEGKVNFDPITNIRPILFIMYDITGEFKVEGGSYKVSFVGLNNGASKQKHIMRAADGISINFSKDRTLHNGLKSLETEINKQYKAYYNKIKDTVESTVDINGEKLKFHGKEVQYILEAEEPYVKIDKPKKFDRDGRVISKPDGRYVLTDFKPQNTEKGKKDEAGSLSFGTAASIESCIMQMVNRCPQIKKDALYSEHEKTGERVKWIPKVASTIITDKEKYKVVYKLRRVMEGRSDIIEKLLKRTSDNKFKLHDDVQKNLLTLDYFYTGLNTDIINFDIKMEMGLAFFQTLVTTDNYPDNEDAQKNKGAKNANGEGQPLTAKASARKNHAVRKNTPIFFSTKFDDKMTKNSIDPGEAASFQSLLNRHAALENLEAKVLIHGNPGLLNATNKLPSEVLGHTSPKETKARVNVDIFPYWETTPAIVKLNIKMPSDDEDEDFSLPFWYEGYYYCYGINQKFNDGEFTQELEMISLPRSPLPKQQGEDKKKKPDETQKAKVSAPIERSDIPTDDNLAAPTTTEAEEQPAESFIDKFIGWFN